MSEILVDCHFCGCPVVFDPSGRLAAIGITLAECERHNLAVICRTCTDMAEVEDSLEIEIIDEVQLKERLSKEAA